MYELGKKSPFIHSTWSKFIESSLPKLTDLNILLILHLTLKKCLDVLHWWLELKYCENI